MPLVFIWWVDSKPSSFSLHNRAEIGDSSETVCTRFPSFPLPTLISEVGLPERRRADCGQEDVIHTQPGILELMKFQRRRSDPETSLSRHTGKHLDHKRD